MKAVYCEQLTGIDNLVVAATDGEGNLQLEVVQPA